MTSLMSEAELKAFNEQYESDVITIPDGDAHLYLSDIEEEDQRSSSSNRVSELDAELLVSGD